MTGGGRDGGSVFVTAQDGLRLHVQEHGSRTAPGVPVVCLPGLTRTVSDFAALAQALANDMALPRRVIAIDSLFSPVRKVKYAVENTRVGQRTDYDKLVLEMWTDGRLTPDEALLQASAILRHHLDLFVDFDKETIEFEESQPQVSQENSKLKKLLNMSVNEIELSVRAANCLNNANITTVGQLAMKTEAEMLKYRNFGKKSLNEIKDKLQNLGLSLGMKLEPGLVDVPATENGKVD